MKLSYKIIILATIIFLFGLLLSMAINWHSYLLYLNNFVFGISLIAAYFIGINNSNHKKKQLIKQCVTCNLFIPFKDGIILEHYCPEKDKELKESSARIGK